MCIRILSILCILLFTTSCGIIWGGVTWDTIPYSIVVTGAFTSYSGVPEPYMARLNSDGSLDTSFTQSGTGLSNSPYTTVMDSVGRFITVGNFTSYNGISEPRALRLNSNGTLDTTFGPTGSGIGNVAETVAIDSSGKIVVGGFFNTYNLGSEPRILRLNTNGSLDGSFGPTGSGLSAQVQAMAIDSSGRIVVGGVFTSYNLISEPYIARLNPNGSLDGTFGPTGSGLSAQVQALAIDSAGRIIVGGAFTSYNLTSEPCIARLNPDGSLDTTFAATGTGFNVNILAIAIDSAGRLVVGGGSNYFNGIFEPYVARLNSDGSLDQTFAPVGTGLNSYVRTLVIDYNGRIVVTGGFTSYNGTSEPYIARLNPDGSLDTTFNPVGTGLNNVVNGFIIY